MMPTNKTYPNVLKFVMLLSVFSFFMIRSCQKEGKLHLNKSQR